MKREQDDMGAPNPDNKDQADDVATLYSWANLHGAKYRDFSASRQEARAQMRQRVLADRARLAREEAQQQKALPAREESPRWDDLLPGAGRPAAASAPVRKEIPAERRLEIPDETERMQGTLPAPGEAGSSPRMGLSGAPYFREEPVIEQRFAAERETEEEAGPPPPGESSLVPQPCPGPGPLLLPEPSKAARHWPGPGPWPPERPSPGA